MIFLSSMQTRGLKINYLRLILLGIVFIFLQLCLRCYAEDVLTSTNKVVLPPFLLRKKVHIGITPLRLALRYLRGVMKT